MHVIFANKTRQNPENEVGLMVMAGKASVILPVAGAGLFLI